jgi:hypothetical protein
MLATNIVTDKPPNVFSGKKFSSPFSARARAIEAFKDLTGNQKKALLSALVLAAHGFDEGEHDLGLFLTKAVYQFGKELNSAA